MSWNLDPTHSRVTFSGKHMLVSRVTGTFADWQIDAVIDENDLTKSSAVITIEAKSVDSGFQMRDDHLRSPDFFDVENHPKITFALKRMEPTGDGEYRLTGDLTIRETTREVTFNGEIAGPVQDPWGGTRLGLSATTRVNRKDWGLDWNVPLGGSGALVSETITLAIDAELVKAG